MTFDSEYEPFFQPPGWIIGPIWAILYTTLIISFFTTFNLRNKINNSNTAIWLFLVQLIVNLAWPRVFNSEEYLISLIMIVIMVIFTSLYAYIVCEVNKKRLTYCITIHTLGVFRWCDKRSILPTCKLA